MPLPSGRGTWSSCQAKVGRYLRHRKGREGRDGRGGVPARKAHRISGPGRAARGSGRQLGQGETRREGARNGKRCAGVHGPPKGRDSWIAFCVAEKRDRGVPYEQAVSEVKR